jgi:hypothetical protein
MNAPLTPPEHEHSALVEQAALWLVEQPQTLENKFLVVQRQFGLTAVQAAQALTLANKFRTCREAFA